MSISDGLLILSGIFIFIVLISYINEKFVKLPSEIGLMTISLSISVVILLLDAFNITSMATFENVIHKLNLHDIILNGFLCFLLFSGAATIRLKDLTNDKLLIGSLSFVSTLISALIYASLAFVITKLIGISMSFIKCCVLGSIIAPTDPISAMSILKKAGLPNRLSIIMEGESLFNDGIAVALFLTFTSLLKETASSPSIIFIKVVGWNVIGSITVGCVVSIILFKLFKRTSLKHLEILISLAAVTTAYSISEKINVSAPSAAVVVGIFFATQMNKLHEDNESYYSNFYTFWNVIDKFLNAVLYILIGIVVLYLQSVDNFGIILISAIFASLIARYISILGPIALFSRNKNMNPKSYTLSIRKKELSAMSKLLTWAGLKGGICIALALGTRNIFSRDQYFFTLISTYAVVVFSTLIQGLTVRKVYERLKNNLH
ncbi:sodium:proton antiporter [Clostridiaceae bacterium M8S5]|nr:sodium:proton antiporter [Clostridiaceae bacterium M8S5]